MNFSDQFQRMTILWFLSLVSNQETYEELFKYMNLNMIWYWLQISNWMPMIFILKLIINGFISKWGTQELIELIGSTSSTYINQIVFITMECNHWCIQRLMPSKLERDGLVPDKIFAIIKTQLRKRLLDIIIHCLFRFSLTSMMILPTLLIHILILMGTFRDISIL